MPLTKNIRTPETKLLELRFAWVMLSQRLGNNKKTYALHQSCTLAADHKTTGRGPFSKAKMVSLCMRSVFLTSVSNTLEIGNASDIIWLIFCSDIIWLIFVLLLGLDGGPGSQQPPPQGTPGIPQQQVQFRQPLPPGMHPRPGQVIKREKILRDTSRFRTEPEFFWDKNALQRPSFQICSDVAKCAWTAKGAKNFFIYKKRIIFFRKLFIFHQVDTFGI